MKLGTTIRKRNAKGKLKPREAVLPVLLQADKRCKYPRPAQVHGEWVEASLSESEIELMMSRIADKQAKAFNLVA